MVLYGIIVILVCMKGWREKISELIRREMKGVPIVYPVTFIIFLTPILFWNIKNILSFDAFTIDDTSARYLLSALVQSLAAIIAIVVTLTLVAVQLSASAYSPRVIDIFKKDWFMWWLLVWYGLSIFFGLFVLEMIGSEYQNLSRWGVPLELCVFLAYLMGIIAFAGLFCHIGNVITLLKPENIIEKLSEGITTEKILKFIESEKKQRVDRTQPVKDDPMRQIVIVINSLIMKYDFESVKDGLKAITDLAIEVMGNLCLFSVSSRFKNDLRRGTISEEFNNEFKNRGYSLSENLNVERINFIPRTTKWRIHDENGREMYRVIEGENEELNVLIDLDGEIKVSGYFCRHFEGIIRLTTEKYETPTIDVIENLKTLGMSTAEKKLEYATKEVLRLLDKWIKVITERGFEGAALHTVSSLGDVGKAAAEKGLEDVTDQAARSLGDVGKTAERNGLERAVGQALESLGQVGKIAAENGLRGAATSAAMDLVFFGRFEIEKGNDYTAERVIWFLEKIGNAAAEKRLEPVTCRAAESLGLLGRNAAEKGKEFEEVTKKVIWRLNSVGVSAEGEGLEMATKQVAQSIICVGVFAVKNGLGDTAQEAAKSLAELSISNEEPVEQAIRESKSKLQKYFELFQKFVNLYEQQLE